MRAKKTRATTIYPIGLTVAQRREMRAEYSVPGRDERVLAVLEQLKRAEERIAQQARDLENQEARLSRRRIENDCARRA